MNVLVIGFGSIGARHSRILEKLGCRTAVVSSRQIDFSIVYSDLKHALESEQPKYVVISNSTDKHHDTFTLLIKYGFTGVVLVEKPLFQYPMDIPQHKFQKSFVAYNLRFHPVIQRLKELLMNEKILSVQAYVGQYLPDWRPDSDYRISYSASAAKGGGVLRDLSHELDFLTWMLGGWTSVNAIGGHLSPLEINSDDVYALMMTTPLCPVVSLQLNYLDRMARRFIIVNTSSHTIEIDLIKNIIVVDKDREIFTVDRDDSYKSMHEGILSDRTDSFCTLDDGVELLKLIEAVEISSAKSEWVNR